VSEQIFKNMTLIVSVGNKDRVHSVANMEATIRRALEKTGYNVTVVSAHYVADGKTYRPDDYDLTTKDIKPGAVPPPWAGGPTTVDPVDRPSTAETKPMSPRAALGHDRGKRVVTRRPR
jgi:hypothetical protein